MQNGAADNRTRLLRAAETVTYRHGFSRTALADIAKEAKFPLGNVYYYFKTKDELGDALVKLRVQRFRKLLETFDKLGDPKDRLCAFVQTKIKNRETGAQRLSGGNDVLGTAQAWRVGGKEGNDTFCGSADVDGEAVCGARQRARGVGTGFALAFGNARSVRDRACVSRAETY